MNIALIIAGGVGSRMHLDVPKQFYHVFDKPVLVYTMEVFEKHPDVDEIAIVCLDGWQENVRAYAKKYNITKLKHIITGGESGQASARNGVYALREHCSDDDIVILHDSIRPMLSADILSDCIATCRIHGNACAAMPCAETILRTQDGISSNSHIPRDGIMRVQTPQAYRFKMLHDGHKKALEQGITNAVYANTMLIELGETIYFSIGSDKNMKITNPDDLAIFKAMIRAKKEEMK